MLTQVFLFYGISCGDDSSPCFIKKDSPLQISILSLFMELKARFGNMVMGMMTRDSVRDAFLNGITADQVRVFR
jgi:transcription initiation factor TFIIH subunit 4